MIHTFACRETEKIFARHYSRSFPPAIQRAALRKLLILDAAAVLDDLKMPPGNRLVRLSGDRTGQYSIRINRQWRICFEWHKGNCFGVEITDYH
ncbi:MAG: type II toxin-antitoxin system RelE/ParE family toxin [Candidatus Omnitrophica bacterium]|nr:type II toxin-antitoxin system RelE/ParE family toxin [Candidatus Omnitrophota bacterium]